MIVTIKLRDGETVRGWIEYFDDSMLRLTREGQPNLFIYKHQIRTISEAGRRRAPRYETADGHGPAARRACERTRQSRQSRPDSDFVPKAAEIAREAGARLREYFAQGVETEYKGDVDLVTVADRTVEKLIRTPAGRGLSRARHLRRRRHARAAGRRVSLVRRPAGRNHELRPRISAVLRFDGPGAPARGHASRMHDGTLVAGGHLRSHARRAVHGRARARAQAEWQADRRFRASAELAEALLATGFPSRKRHASPNIHFYQEFTLRSHGVRRAGSAALDLAYVACGRMEAFWEFNLNPWDTAAGILLVEEAGGRVTDFAGAHFRLDSDEILASNGLIHEELIGFFDDMFAGRNLSPIPTAEEFARARERSRDRNSADTR